MRSSQYEMVMIALDYEIIMNSNGLFILEVGL
jgi:hypothetical protein